MDDVLLPLHRARDRDVVQRIAQFARGGAGQRGDHQEIRAAAGNAEKLRRKIAAMEKRYDSRFQAVFEAIRQMLESPVPMKKRWDFTPKRLRRQSSQSRINLSVNNRKQVRYQSFEQISDLENAANFSYTLFVVDSQKTPTNRHVHQAIQHSHCAPRQEPECCKPGETNLRNFRRRGIVFATSRSAGRDGAGTLRVPVFLRDQRVRRRPGIF